MPDQAGGDGPGPRRSLAASVAVTEDIPVLRVAEARAAPVALYGMCARGYRLDTVEEDEAAATSLLRLPNAQGAPPSPYVLFLKVRCQVLLA